MRPVIQRLSALGVAPWVTTSYLQEYFNIGLAVVLDSGAALTAAVQFTYDDTGPAGARLISFSQATTVVTVTDNNHGLSVGDSVVIQGSGAGIDGTYTVASVTNANVYTFTAEVSQTAVSPQMGCVANNLRVFTHSTLTGLTARASGSISAAAATLPGPVQAVRLAVTAYTSGAVTLNILQGMGS